MLRLAELEKELDDVEFPNGAVHKPVPFGKDEYKLWRDLQSETDAMTRGKMLLSIVTACYPNATADDFDSCTPKMLIAMAAHAGRKIDQIRDALKNADAVAQETAQAVPPQAEQDTAPSSPKTSGTTSSRGTRKRSAKTGGTSTTASPTENQNASGSPSISWTSPAGSTISGGSSTTSTVPA